MCHVVQKKYRIQKNHDVNLVLPRCNLDRVRDISYNPSTQSFLNIANIIFKNSNHKLMQLLLDCSVIPEIIASSQSQGEQVFFDLFYFSRTCCFSVHWERLKRLGKWNFREGNPLTPCISCTGFLVKITSLLTWICGHQGGS